MVCSCPYIFSFNIECSTLNHRGQTENECKAREGHVYTLDQLALLIYLQPPMSGYSQL